MTRARTAGVLLIVLVAFLSGSGTTEAAEIAWTPAHPVAGEPVSVWVTEDGAPLKAAVQAVYQPESEVARTEEVGLTAADGLVSWTPARGGVVRLSAVVPEADSTVVSQTLSVRFRGVPVMGLVVMIVAGLILYGGVIRGFRLLSAAPPPSPPDT